MADSDVARVLAADERSALDDEAFRALIPNWPEWMRIAGRPSGVGPEANTVFHTRYDGRHFALTTPDETSCEEAARSVLYGVVANPRGTTWTPLRSEETPDRVSSDEGLLRLRRNLPTVLANLDLTSMGRDGEPSPWERRYSGVHLKWKAYERWSDEWDHDHCTICGATFSVDEPGALTEGYAIQGGPHGDDYDWVCGPCVDAYRESLAFIIE